MRDMFDYIGLVACRCDDVLRNVEGIADEYVSSFQCFQTTSLGSIGATATATTTAAAVAAAVAAADGAHSLPLLDGLFFLHGRILFILLIDVCARYVVWAPRRSWRGDYAWTVRHFVALAGVPGPCPHLTMCASLSVRCVSL
jgi:hypothetical protein